MNDNTVCTFNRWALFMEDTTQQTLVSAVISELKWTEMVLKEHKILQLVMVFKTYGLHLGTGHCSVWPWLWWLRALLASCKWMSVVLRAGEDPGFCQRGLQLLRTKIADVTKWSYTSGASLLWPGSRAYSRALEAFGFLMLKYTFSHIVETLFPLFLTTSLTPKSDKNNIYIYHIVLQSIWDIFMLLHHLQLCIFYIFMKKLCLWLFDLEVKCQVKWG